MTSAPDGARDRADGAADEAVIEHSVKALEAAAEESDRGNRAEAERIVDGVKAELDAVIEADPDNLAARRVRGRVNQSLGHPHDAVADYAEVTQREPSADAFSELGDVNLALDELDAAYAAYTRALELDSGHEQASIGRGIVHGQRSEFDLAEGEFSRVLERDPGNLDARRWRGLALMAAGRTEEAVVDLEAVAEAAPSAELLCQLGDARFAMKDDRAAAAAFDQARTIDPENARAWRGLGMAMTRRDEPRLGIEYLTRSLELEPASSVALAERAEARATLEDLDGAERDFSRALELDPGYPWAHVGRGRVHGRQGRYDQALEDFSTVIERNPTDVEARRLRGVTYDRLGRYEEAVTDFEAVVEAGPDAAALCSVGEARWSLGDLTGAEAAFDRALELDPSLARALVGRGAMLGARAEHEQAVQAFSRAIEVADEDDPYARSLRGHTLMRIGRYEEALADYRAVADAQPGVDAFLDRADALRTLGRLEEAIADCERALEVDPSSVRGLVARGHLRIMLRHHELAIEDLSAALELDPTSLTALHLRGIANESLARYSDALADYDAVARALPSAEALCNRGDASVGMADMEAAEADYTAALELDAECVRAWLGRGRARGRRGDLVQAEEDFSRAIEIDPENLEARQLRGHVLGSIGRHEEALIDYGAVAEGAPHAAAYCDIGDVQMALNEFPAAREAFSRALELEPDLARACFGRGCAFALENQLEPALADLSKGLEREPGNADARRLRGAVLKNLGRWEEALSDYEVIIESAPSAQAFNDRGEARLAVGDARGAETDYAEALERDPALVDAYLGRGRLFAGRGDYDEARAEFDAAIAMDEGNADAYAGRGAALAALADSEQATWDYDRALELNPEHVGALQGRSFARAQIAEGFRVRRLGAKALDAFRASLRDLELALELTPANPSLLGERSRVLRGLGAYDRAAESAEQGLATVGEDTPTAIWLLVEQGESLRGWGEELAMKERVSGAMDVLETAKRMAGEEVPAWLPDSLGLTLVALERYSEAVEQFEQAVALDESNGWAFVGLGRALYLLGEAARARRAFERALDIGADEAVDVWSRVGRGLSLRAEGDVEEAARSLDTVLRSEPVGQQYVDRAFCFLGFRELELGEADLLKALELDPEAGRAANALAWFYVDTVPLKERFPRALELARTGVDHAVEAADHHEALDTLGWVLFKLGRFGEAVEPLERAREFNPEGILYRWHVAEAEAALSAA